jgi:hypothetical protein
MKWIRTPAAETTEDVLVGGDVSCVDWKCLCCLL